MDQPLISSDRANIGNVKILQSGTDDNISRALHLVGRDFNWLNGRKGLSSWQWLFITESAITIFMAVPVYFLLLTFPETSTALSERRMFITRQGDGNWN
ncbi:hypothetical protein PG997_001598 [Apiospora hydei]|uniref:Uncharacterized protein n=1 Tax=Apiospora hydei TaxID=1337664 RepID=A0ABR1XE04_9PEZI